MSFRQEMFERRKAFLVFVPLVLLYFTSYFQRTALPGTIFDTLVSDLRLNATQVATIGASFVYTYAVFQLISGVLVDRFCGTRVVTVGGVFFLAGIMLFPLCSSFGMLCAARMLAGAGASSMYLGLVRETDRLFGRKNYAVMFGIAYFCGYGGGLAGSLPFERLCAIYPWRDVLLVSAAVSLVCYLALLWGKTKNTMPPIPKEPFSFRPFRHVLGNPLSWLLILCANVNFCAYFIIQTVFGKKFLQDFAGFSSVGAAGVIFALTLVCMGTMLTTSILTRLTGNRRRPLIIGACGCCLLGSLLMVLAIRMHFPAWTFAVVYMLFAVAAGIPPIFSMVMQEFNSRDIMAQAAAVLNMFGYLSVAIFSQLIGMLLDSFGAVELPDGSLTYPENAYLTLFVFVTAVAAAAFAAVLKVPETGGHYLHLHVTC